MFSAVLVLLMASVNCVHSYELTQPASLTVRPDATLTIDCKVSYSVTDYGTAWIRQPAGKALEWIGVIWSGGSLAYKDSLKSMFSITRDTSSNTITLQGKNMQAQDTAVYYCAKFFWAGAFDYWGKGTRVIVTGEAPKPPAVLMMSSCERSSTPSSDSLILGCLASGYSPAESVSFKWTDQSGKALTDFIQYPSGNTTLTVSHITISKTKFNQSKIICAAEHPSETISQTFRKVHTQTPTLSLAPVTTPKSTSVMCVIEDFYPEKLSVQWKVNDNNSLSQSKPLTKLNEDTGFYTAFSFYEVSSETWNTNPSYTCEVTHQGKPISVKGSIKAKFTLTLKPPIERELFVHNKIVLEAVVSGDIKETVQEASVSCKVKNEPVTSQNIIPGKAFADNSLFKRIHNVTIDTKKWFDGEMITCTIRDTNNNRDINQEIRFDKGDGKIPSVSIYRPDHNTSFSLVCEVTSPKLGNVYLMWKVGTDPYKEGKTSAPILREDYKSVLSILTVTKQQYHTTTFTCAVKHANMENMSAPLQVTTSPNELPEPEKGFALNCNKDVLEEDEFRSLWSTATSFIFLFLFSLTYSAVLSLFKMKQR